MNKDEILEKAKKEKLLNDESQNNKGKKGKQWGILGTTIVLFIIMIINLRNNKDISQLFTIYGSYIVFENAGKYFANKEKTDLIPFVAGLVIAIASSKIWIRELWNF